MARIGSSGCAQSQTPDAEPLTTLASGVVAGTIPAWVADRSVLGSALSLAGARH